MEIIRLEKKCTTTVQFQDSECLVLNVGRIDTQDGLVYLLNECYAIMAIIPLVNIKYIAIRYEEV